MKTTKKQGKHENLEIRKSEKKRKVKKNYFILLLKRAILPAVTTGSAISFGRLKAVKFLTLYAP